ncbi:MAG: metal ABC transporter ATP-binding protein [Phycisphaerales bacterium]
MSAGAIEFAQVTYTYPGGGAPAVEDLTFSIAPGERVGVLGPNGGGKSTLVKLALGELTGYTWEIRIFGEAPARARRRGEIGDVAQRSGAELRFPISVRQMVELAAARDAPAWRMTTAASRERTARALELTGASEYAARPVGDLSGGQLQRALIARALAVEPRVLALDEPLVGVDAPGQQRFSAMLSRLHAELGVTILMVSHDLRAIASTCDKVLCLSRRMHMHGSPEGLTPAVLAEVFRHDVASALGEVHVEAHLAEECPGDHAHAHDTTRDEGAS